MNNNIKNILLTNFKDYQIQKINNEASHRKYYRLKKNNKLLIFMDSSEEPNEFFSFINIHNILSEINISIPKIYEIDSEKKIILLEDFGDRRFDKIMKYNNIKNLLSVAVDSLIILKKEINFNSSYEIPTYNYNTFKKEISEFIDFFYPYYIKAKIPLDLKEEFFDKWKNQYNELNLNYTSFVHKDYNLNNLIYLSERTKHYKCGIIDFQNAFWGEDCWDLFSLLEDSRQYFDDQYNEFYINYYYLNTKQNNSIQLFKDKYYFFNCSRQTRLLGRWVQLSKNFNQKWYLDFINITNKRLIKCLQIPSLKKIKILYHKLIPDLYDY